MSTIPELEARRDELSHAWTILTASVASLRAEVESAEIPDPADVKSLIVKEGELKRCGHALFEANRDLHEARDEARRQAEIAERQRISREADERRRAKSEQAARTAAAQAENARIKAEMKARIAAESAARQPTENRAFINAARRFLSPETYRFLWAEAQAEIRGASAQNGDAR
jgi:multidrug resistance efflux pump